MRISDWSSDVCSSDLHCPGSEIDNCAVSWPISRESLRPPGRLCRSQRECPGMCGHLLSRWIEPMPAGAGWMPIKRSEEHTSELQSLMRISYAVFCLKKKNIKI